jgi:hypothetical protein
MKTKNQKSRLTDLNFKMDHIYQNPEFGQEWFTYPNLYKSVVLLLPPGSKFVEVGSWKGKSSAFMAVEIANSGKNIEFYCVDHWIGSIEHYDRNSHTYEPEIHKLYQTFIDNMKPVESYYKPMRMTSLEASNHFEDQSLDFVFIDASHQYEDVCNDIDVWIPKVKTGGFLAGHDYCDSFVGVKEAVNQKIKNFSTSESCWISQVTR